jgi:mRNA interferase MazF
MTRRDFPKRGEIWRTDLEPTRGDEIRKTRPVVILSVAEIGKLNLRIVVPVTEWNERFSGYSWMVRLDPNPANGLTKPSAADAFQVRSLSIERLQEKVGELSAATVDAIVDAVVLCIGYGTR